MAKGSKIARRGFLIGSAAIAGGVAFGVVQINRPHPNPLLATLEDDEASGNPWVTITPHKITIYTPHVDVGQGAVHMQSLLVAEEMDLEPGQFETAFGSPDAAYFNTAIAADNVPFPVTERGRLAQATRSAANTFSKVLGLQVTGGSTSVPDSFDKLRRAGAVTRETLKLAAAQAYAVPVSELTTQAGAVILPDGRAVAYTDLAAAAADIKPVQDVALRSPEAWRLVGKPTRRPDAEAKVFGAQPYGIDLRLEGMAHASVRLSPTRGPVLRADLEAARATRGVSDIVPLSNGFAVLADNTWSAMQGAQAIDVDWGPAPYPAEQADHWQAVADAFTPDALDREWRADGDVDTAGGSQITAEYRAPYVAHQPLEPLNATIHYRDGMAEIWAAHQMPRFAQDMVAEVLGIASDKVIFHNQFAGGSFGHRLEFENIICAAEIAKAKPDAPVKVTWSREEDFARDYPRHIGMARGTARVADGQVDSFDLQIAGAPVTASQVSRLGYPAAGPDNQLAAGAWNAPYAIPHFRVRAYRAEGLAPVSSWRSVGASSCGFFLEGMLDEAIHAAGADPMEERLRLCSWEVARGTLDAVAEMSGWGTSLPAGSGRGVAIVESFGVPAAMVVQVTSTSDGIRLDDVWIAVDAGQVVDPDMFEHQVQGGVIWGLGHAINSEVTFSDGRVEQSNYHDAEGLRLYQTPPIEVRALMNNPDVRGIGEPTVPPAAPALANAIFAATGQRLREMPFFNSVDFL